MMPTLPPARAFAFLALAAFPLAAQDAAQEAKAEQVVLSTSETTIAMMLMHGAVPDIEEGQHYRLVLGADGEWTCTAAGGEAGLLSLRARPALLMETFAEQVEQVRQMAEMAATMQAGNSPVGKDFLGEVFEGMFAFPAQLDVLTLTVRGDRTKGYDAHAELTPLAGGWFDGVVAGLKPSGKGTLPLPDGGMTMAFDFAPAAFEPALDRLIQLTLSMIPEAQREATRGLIEDSWKVFDGTGAFAMQGEKMTMLYGCTDPQKLAAMMASEDWTKMQQAIMAEQADAQMKVTRGKVGDLDVVRLTGEMDNPMFPDGKFESASCVAGDMLVSTVNAGDDALRTLAARAAEAKRSPLPGGALMTVRMNLADLAALGGDPDLDPAELPKSVDCRVGRKADAAVLTIDVRVER